MKRRSLLVIACLLIMSSIVSAQFKKGQKMAGASLVSGYFNAGTYEYTFPAPTNPFTSNTNSIGIQLSPDFGWFINSRLVIGGRLNLAYRYEKALDETNNVSFRKREDKELLLGAGFFTRYYLTNSKSFIPFGQFSLDFGSGSSRSEGYYYASNYKETYEGKSSGDFFIMPGLMAGVTKMLNANTGLDFFAGYQLTYHKKESSNTTYRDVDFDGTIDETGYDTPTSKLTNHGVMIGVGFRIFLD